MNPTFTQAANTFAKTPGLSTAQQNAILSTAKLPPVGNVVDSGQLGNTGSLKLPNQTPPSAGANLNGAISSNIAQSQLDKELETNINNAQTNADTSKTDYKTAITDLLNLPKEQQDLETQYDISGKKNLVNSYSQQLLAEQNALNNQKNDIYLKSGGLTSGTNEAIANAERQSLSKQADISVAKFVADNDLKSAQDIIDKKIAMETEALKTKADYYKTFYQDNKDTLTKAEADKIANLTKQADREYQQTLQDKQQVGTIQLEAAKNGAPASVISAISGAKDQNAAIEAAKSYLTTPQYDFQNVGGTLYKVDKRTGNASPVAGQAPDSNNPSNPDVGNLTSGNGSILNATGLSLLAFNYITGGTGALTRLDSATRNKVINEANNWLKTKGIDNSTFQSQYKAYNDVLQKNVERANNTTIYAGEITGTVDQFINEAANDFGNLKWGNVAKVFAGQEVNDPTAQKYAFNLQTLRNDLAGYYAASRGSNQPEAADLADADSVIKNGLNTRSATAFKDSIIANEGKVNSVVNNAVTSARRQVWGLFGVGSQFKDGGGTYQGIALPSSESSSGSSYQGITLPN